MRNNNFLPKETVLRIIDSPRTKEQMVDMIKGIPEVEAVEIKEGATVGDIMKIMFPEAKITEGYDSYPKVYMHLGEYDNESHMLLEFTTDIWNSPFKK
jgi:L-ribulose-5-phosphate 3-epimerase UlaE